MRLLSEIAFGVWLVAVWGLSKWRRPLGLVIGSAAACVALAGAILDHGGWTLPVLAFIAVVTLGATAYALRTRRRWTTRG